MKHTNMIDIAMKNYSIINNILISLFSWIKNNIKAL